MKRVLVTGGAGYIGSHAVRVLCDRGFEVSVLDNLVTGHRDAVDARARFYEGDVADLSMLQRIHVEAAPEGVLHFAALSQVGESVQKPALYLNNNFEKAKVLIDFCVQSGINRFIFSSTAAVYGSPLSSPIQEDFPCQPINPYGESKRRLEEYLSTTQEPFSWMIFRYFNVAGAWPDGSLGERHDPETHLIPRVLLNIQKGEHRASIFGDDYPTRDGTCVRDYVHVLDLVDAHLMGLEVLDRLPSTVFNLGSDQGFSVLEVIDAIERTVGEPLERIRSSRRSGDPAMLVASASKARKLLGWAPRFGLSEMIAHAWQFFQRSQP